MENEKDIDKKISEIRQKRRKETQKRWQKIRLMIIAAVLLCMTLFTFILPLRPKVSEAEKRTLAEFPKFSFSALFGGSYFSGISAWYADTVPFRDYFTDLSSKLQHFLGTGTAQAGFNEGVKGDDIPDVPDTPATLPVDVSDATDPSSSADPLTEPSSSESQTSPTTTEAEEESRDLQQLSDILIYGNAGFEYYNFVQATAEKYAAVVNRAAALVEGKATVYDMIIPTSIDIQLPDSVRATLSVSDQAKAINYMEALLSPSVKKVSIFDTLKAHKNEYIYFRTDHHWTQLGAYYAYQEFCKVKGVQPVSLDDCEYRAFHNFTGSFFLDSGKSPVLGDTPDIVEAYMPAVNADLRITEQSGNQFTGSVIYNAETNSPYYKYSAFIWGDNPFSVITNYDMEQGESCLFIKESFGNALAPFLTYNYKYVYILDYRYGYSTVAALVDQYNITDVFFCNNISMTRASSLVNQLNGSVG